jgi:hypothetical protein
MLSDIIIPHHARVVVKGISQFTSTTSDDHMERPSVNIETHLFKKTVPASRPVANSSSNTRALSSFASAFVHTEAVSPYGLSFISASAASSDGTYKHRR